MLKKYLSAVPRLIFALWYFGVGVIGFIMNVAVKDAAQASTAFEQAMAETGFMNLLLCLACFSGGGSLGDRGLVLHGAYQN